MFDISESCRKNSTWILIHSIFYFWRWSFFLSDFTENENEYSFSLPSGWPHEIHWDHYCVVNTALRTYKASHVIIENSLYPSIDIGKIVQKNHKFWVFPSKLGNFFYLAAQESAITRPVGIVREVMLGWVSSVFLIWLINDIRVKSASSNYPIFKMSLGNFWFLIENFLNEKVKSKNE